MAGILDNKKRVMDVIITSEGRRQMYNGNLVMKYASFTDTHAFYQADAVSGSADASNRIYLEAASLPLDQVTFETDDTGQLIEYEGNGDINLDETGTIYSGSTPVYNDGSYSSAFASMANTLLSSSIENFRNLNIIGTKDPFNDEFFDVDNSEITFEIIASDVQDSTTGVYSKIATPIPNANEKIGWINTIEPLFLDWRLGWLENFKYKMPLIRSSDSDYVIEYLGQDDFESAWNAIIANTGQNPIDDALLGGWKVYNLSYTSSDFGGSSNPCYVHYQPDPLTGYPAAMEGTTSGTAFSESVTWHGMISESGEGTDNPTQWDTVTNARMILYSILCGGGSFVNPDDVSEESTPANGGVWLPYGRIALGAYAPLSGELSLGMDITTDHIPQTDLFDSATNCIGEAWELIEYHISGSWDWSESGPYGGAAYTGEFSSGDKQTGHGNQSTGNAGSITTRESNSLSAIYKSLPMHEIDFVKRSRYNNMFIQIFEVGSTSNTMIKLDMIDVPEYTITREDGSTSKRKAVFAGKVYTDSYGMPTFVNIFTIVFVKDPT